MFTIRIHCPAGSIENQLETGHQFHEKNLKMDPLQVTDYRLQPSTGFFTAH